TSLLRPATRRHIKIHIAPPPPPCPTRPRTAHPPPPPARGLPRRSFLAASAATLTAAPALGAPRPAPAPDVPRSGWVDAVIVGAGAAGIAAGRRLAAGGKRFVVLEAADNVGGRC